MYASELKNLCFVYSKNTPFEKTALDGVDVYFEQGKITGLIGHTGSGKSTVAQLLNGLIKPESGDVFLFEKNIWDEPKKIKEVRFTAGLIFQYPEYQLFEETVRKDIAFGPKNMGLSETEINDRIDEAIKFVGLGADILDKSPFELSGGQRRRVSIAGVIAMRPKLLILDEPAAGLDPRARKEILENIKQYNEATGSSIIMISHSMEDMACYCDRLVVMNKGKIYITGTCGEVFGRANELMEVGLTVPQITELLDEMKLRGYQVNTSLYTVNDAYEEILRLIGGVK